LSIFLCSCKKETVYFTQAQLTAQRLQSTLGVVANTNYNTYSISVYNLLDGSIVSLGGTAFTITSDGYIIVTFNSGTSLITVPFNLEQLKAFQIVPTNNLVLYF
jgi:hypothetical protein